MTIALELTAALLGVLPLYAMKAAEEGSASGWLEQGGRRVPLKYAFAVLADDPMEGGGKEKIEVLLSDQPVPPELRKATEAWSYWASEQARKGELHGIMVYITPATKVWSRGQLLTTRGLMFYSQSSSSPELNDLVFAPAPAGPGEVAGTVSMKKAMTLLEETPWRVEAEFRAAVMARPAVTASLTGDAARSGGPYKAVQAYLQACRKKDLEAIKRTMNAAAQPLLIKMASQDKSRFLDTLAAEAAETLKMKLTTVTVRRDSAEVEFSDDSGNSRQTMNVTLENGTWKIGQ